MTRIPATDYEGRYLEPFLSFIVRHMTTDDTTQVLKKEWGAEFVDGVFPGSAAYIEFEDPEMATAFSLRYSHAVNGKGY